MADKFDKETRSRIMSKIRGKNTKPEILLRKKLFQEGFRYSLKYRFKEKNFIPDIVMVSRKICIFVDGCFWHKCPKCFKEVKSNKKYWKNKIDSNVKRDKAQNKFLVKNGWKVIRVWEHEINNNVEKIKNKILKKINQN